MKDYAATLPLCGDVELVAIASRRIVIVGDVRRILGEGVVYISIYRIAVAVKFPVAGHWHHAPRLVIVVHTPELLGTLGRRSTPMETPLATYILYERGLTARQCLLRRGVWHKRSTRRELILGKHLGILPIGVLRHGCNGNQHKYSS